jgi:hypothetical protein
MPTSLPGPLSILGRDLNPHGAGHGIVSSRKSAPTDQILNALALNDVPIRSPSNATLATATRTGSLARNTVTSSLSNRRLIAA